MFIKYSTLTTTIFIIIGETLAYIFNLYEKIPTYDNYMHFLGGIWVTSFLLLFIYTHSKITIFNASKIINIILLISIVMSIGVLWEFYEFTTYTIFYTILPTDIYADTIFDLFFDLCGAVSIALLFFLSKRTIISNSTLPQ